MAEIIPHWLDKQAALSPNELALEIPDKETLTFKELQERSQSFARKLAGIGVKCADHVAIYAHNSSEMVVMIHALSYLGAVAVLLNTRLAVKEISFQLNNAEVGYILTDVSLPSDVFDFTAPIYSVEEVHQLNEEVVELLGEINLDDLFTIIYTSGTTGKPKGVQHTYGNHWWSAIASALNLGIDNRDKWLASLPLFHVGGLSILIKSVIYGMPVYLLEKFDEQVVHNGIVNQGVTIVSVVSLTLQRLVDVVAESNQFYPSSFRCMLLGGGPAPEPLLQKAKSLQIPVYQTYGMTETSSQIVTLSPRDALDKLGSAGKPLFPAQLKIVLEGEIANNYQVGEIHVKGAMVTKGYFRAEDANRSAFDHNGWLATGDMGYVDAEGFLYVMDRRKDLIISGGENIYPAELESVLSGCPGVKDVAIVGKIDSTWGQTPVAFVVVEEKEIVTADEVISYCSKYLAKYKIPKEVYFLEQLPRTASNKVIRHQLSKLLNN
ncbi:o-succinylbenzoate--CoA ligase [Aquibacillus kalidii]|uniref:o-succinylbenzoate--CoA ligase n=1 Tax=Aquibacillus kalidii TaxID=2762597 RepID=UPI00164885A6|nr:o-succinylbenzoate--CoA ligase [Aquibacillus kalidii]